MVNGHSMNTKKKYESLLGKHHEFSKTKYIKTEEDVGSFSNIIAKKDTHLLKNSSQHEK